MKIKKWIFLILIIVILSSEIHNENNIADDVVNNFALLEHDYYALVKADTVRQIFFCYKETPCVEEVLGSRSIPIIAKDCFRNAIKAIRRDVPIHNLLTINIVSSVDFYKLWSINDTLVYSRKTILNYIHNQDGEKG